MQQEAKQEFDSSKHIVSTKTAELILKNDSYATLAGKHFCSSSGLLREITRKVLEERREKEEHELALLKALSNVREDIESYFKASRTAGLSPGKAEENLQRELSFCVDHNDAEKRSTEKRLLFPRGH
jgi:hypothetical protein